MSWKDYHAQPKNPECVKIGKMIQITLYRLDLNQSQASRMCKKRRRWLNEFISVGKTKNMVRVLELLDARIPGFMEQFLIVKKNFELEGYEVPRLQVPGLQEEK